MADGRRRKLILWASLVFVPWLVCILGWIPSPLAADLARDDEEVRPTLLALAQMTGALWTAVIAGLLVFVRLFSDLAERIQEVTDGGKGVWEEMALDGVETHEGMVDDWLVEAKEWLEEGGGRGFREGWRLLGRWGDVWAGIRLLRYVDALEERYLKKAAGYADGLRMSLGRELAKEVRLEVKAASVYAKGLVCIAILAATGQVGISLWPSPLLRMGLPYADRWEVLKAVPEGLLFLFLGMCAASLWLSLLALSGVFKEHLLVRRRIKVLERTTVPVGLQEALEK